MERDVKVTLTLDLTTTATSMEEIIRHAISVIQNADPDTLVEDVHIVE